jgi:hypothetical protein
MDNVQKQSIYTKSINISEHSLLADCILSYIQNKLSKCLTGSGRSGWTNDETYPCYEDY